MKTLSELVVGDSVVRTLAGSIDMPLKVTAVTDTRICCGPWEFSRKTGHEIDEDLDWDGETRYGSTIRTDC